ncbi:gliding motility-associated C-terminal domain-containing protein, partial [Crocinitomicaceae bacterium]|nr:gliding motility-associated C-terminal domain-containing protein [Crocinitomicaceae bacterium]
VVVNGVTYDESNPSGTEILTNTFGCDSTVTIDLTFNNVNNGSETYTGCSGDGYVVLVNGVTYDESNPSGTESMSNVFGCDSTISIGLTFNSPSSGSEVHTGCNGDGYTVVVNGVTYDESNPAGIETLTNLNGCDSIVTINLTFNSSITGNESYTGCTGDGYSVVVNGTTYDEANPSGTETLTAVAGCDSIVTVDLVFNTVFPGTDVQSACDSYTWIDGNTYTTSNNSATWVLPSVSGCDSTVTLDLTITNSNTGTDTKSACDTYTWIDGNTYTANNNSATWILTNIDGCDSLVTLDLTINASPTLIDFSNGGIYCEGESINSLTAEVSGVPDFTLDYTLNGNPLSISSSSSSIDVGSSAGEYTLNALTDNYCTTTLNQSQTIVINPIPDIPSLGDDAVYCSNAVPEAIQATGSTGSYNWYVDAALTELIVTADEYTPDMILGSYTYYVTASENGCEGLPAEISITFEDCQIIIPTAFTPDDDQVNDFWELGNIDEIYPNNVVSVYNRLGNKVYASDQGAYSQRPWNGDYNGSILPVASYYYTIEYNDNLSKNKIGIVSIIK